MEYARQIKRIMDALTARQAADATLADVSNMIHKSPAWISDQLRLLGLRPDIQKAVERGEIPRKSAYTLAKLPHIHQVQLVERAKTIPSREFVPVAARLVKQIQESARQGKLHDLCKDFEPVPHLRSLKDVLTEYREHQLGGLALTKADCKTPVAGWYLALQWVLNLDEESIRQQRERVLARSRANLLERRIEPCDDNECPTFSMPES